MTNKHYLPQSETTYKTLQSFDNVEQMNDAIKTHKQAHKLSETDRNVLDAISRYACKYAGVSYLSKQKIAEDAGYKSRRTAIRSCKRLEALGIIVQHETRRIKGDRRRSSNIIVIKGTPMSHMSEEVFRTYGNFETSRNIEAETAVSRNSNRAPSHVMTTSSYSDTYTESNIKPTLHSEVTAGSHSIEAPSKAKSSNTYKETGKPRKLSASDVIKRGLRNALPSAIYDALEPFYDGQALYDTYGILLRAKARIDRNITLEAYADRYIDAFYNVIRLFKAGKVRSLNGLLYVTWERLSAEISRQMFAEA